MPEFAQFIAFRDSDEAFPATGRTFTFDLPDLDLKRTVILMFKVSGPSGVRLWMLVNSSAGNSIDFNLDSTFAAPRSWHEIVPEGVFRVADNHLIVGSDSSDSETSPKVSDIVVLYHAKTL